MKRSASSILFLVLGMSAWAQCPLSVYVPEGGPPTCGPVLSQSVYALSGTPPYSGTVTWFSGIAPISTSPFSSALPEFMVFAPNQGEFINKVVVDMMDGAGCTASGERSFAAKVTLHVNCTSTLVPGQGTYTLRAQFIDDFGSGIPWNMCQPAAIHYQLDGAAMSTLQAGWTLEPGPGFYYSLPMPLPPGSHRIVWTAGETVQCAGESWSRLWCLPSGYASDFWLAPTVATPEQNGLNFAIRAGLQGPMTTSGYMSDALRVSGLIPLTEPYSALGYTYVGSTPGSSTTPAVLATTGATAPVDWVVVEVRAATSPYALLGSQPALITRGGDVVRPDGTPYLHFGSIAAGSLRIALRHRNHLAAMTGVRSLSAAISYVDLYSSSVAGSMFGTAALVNSNGRTCLWAGDATGNGQLKYTGSGNDRDPILLAVGGTTPNATVPNVYDRRDTNLDGVIKYTGTANDRDIILTNVGSTTPNSTRTQQVP